MKAEKYQVRWRGKTSGPFDLPTLRGMLDRNEVSLLHQVFKAGRWIPLEDLLHDQAHVLEPTISDDIAVAAPAEPDGQTPPPLPVEERFYVARDGQKQGPYTVSVLRQLYSAGLIGRDDLAWKEGLSTWSSLGSLVSLPALPLPATGFGIAADERVTKQHLTGNSNIAAGMAAFTAYQSHEIRKELRELNKSIDEIEKEVTQEDVSDAGSWDFSGF
jgi:hypothetical protein